MARFIVGVAMGFIAVVLLQSAAAQTVHVVGDSLGWTIPMGNTAAYANWASTKSFVVGDILTFNFTINTHDVLRVEKTSFDACTDSNSIGDIITTGPVNITLDSAGDHYYICTISGHCQLGQKLAITVSSSRTGGTPPPSTPTTPPTTPSPTNTPVDCPTDPPTSGPTSSKTPRTMRPTTTTTPPDSSSSKVLAGVLVSIMGFIMGLLI